MALPNNELASQNFPSEFIGGRAIISPKNISYELGGISLSDPTQGHLVQIWKAEVVDRSAIIISNELGFVATYYEDFNITEVSLTFDQNMRPAIALVADGQAKLIWFDTFEGMEIITNLAQDVISPRVSLDDKRPRQMGTNDIILAYLRGTNLYHRRQRDRFTIEYLLAEAVVPADEIWYLRRIGMNTGNRFQFELFRGFEQEELIADMLSQAAAITTEGPYTPSAAAAITFDSQSSTIYAPDNEQED